MFLRGSKNRFKSDNKVITSMGGGCVMTGPGKRSSLVGQPQLQPALWDLTPLPLPTYDQTHSVSGHEQFPKMEVLTDALQWNFYSEYGSLM